MPTKTKRRAKLLRTHFRVEELAALVDMSAQTIRNWTVAGVVKPAVRGRTGPGGFHLYSPEVSVGVAFVAAFLAAGFLDGRRQVQAILAEFARMPWEELKAWLADPADPWEDEAKTDRATRGNWDPLGWIPQTFRDAMLAAMHDARSRCRRVFEAVEAKAKGVMRPASGKTWKRERT
jgi:hypothetical protein